MNKDSFDIDEMIEHLTALGNSLNFIENLSHLDDHHEYLLKSLQKSIKEIMRYTIANTELK